MRAIDRILSTDPEKVCVKIENGLSITYQQIKEITKANQSILKAIKRKKSGQPAIVVDISIGWKLIPVFLACFLEKLTLVPVDRLRSPNLTHFIHQQFPDVHFGPDDFNSEGEMKDEKNLQYLTHYKELKEVAFVLYTSGTTSNPKGVMLTYDNILINAEQIKDRLKLKESDCLLVARPLSYASSITGEIFAGLLAGSSFLFKAPSSSPLRIINHVKQHNVSILFLTPSLTLKLLELRSFLELTRLKAIVLSGEILYTGQFQIIRAGLPKTVAIYNGYGLTEASPRVAIHKIDTESFVEGCVGVPLNGIKIKILDEVGRKLPDQSKGVLHIKGPNIMKGYLKQKKLTREVKKNGWLNTNDLAEIRNKQLIIHGRADNTIIRHGMNIQLEEIESLLNASPFVNESVVIKRESENKKVTLEAWIVPSSTYQMSLLQKEIHSWDQKLWPDKIVLKQEMPKTQTGKLRRTGN
ncbi:long-chain acyl-CoA synthetase [Fictibacillus solisalsi]|uniref:Long-chain acyl-CoA synthetase n=1 Tax=Fictibacillus solisalsi TaxID=459525 RepID=A0A1H0BQW2_9BACL|nr:fatty acid--CoA ligase family protein [Fictibacillus solisalsi]SDN48039.1 long-chain acyl-CoA synthetase [Fictibacillus solisalsi]